MAADLEIRTAAKGDHARISTVLGRAFQVEPVYQWLFPDPAVRARRLGLLLGTFVRHLHAGLGTVEVATADGTIVGVALWDGPGATDPGSLRTLRALPGMFLATRGKLLKLAMLGSKLDGFRPTEPHWYLSHLGADPDRQARGVGTALLRERLAPCDAAGLPAYLECKPSHVGYYERFGFQVRNEVVVDETLSMLAMWREPAAT